MGRQKQHKREIDWVETRDGKETNNFLLLSVNVDARCWLCCRWKKFHTHPHTHTFCQYFIRWKWTARAIYCVCKNVFYKEQNWKQIFAFVSQEKNKRWRQPPRIRSSLGLLHRKCTDVDEHSCGERNWEMSGAHTHTHTFNYDTSVSLWTWYVCVLVWVWLWWMRVCECIVVIHFCGRRRRLKHSILIR